MVTSKQFQNWDPDAGLPHYLRDRRNELYNPLKESKITY